MQANKKTKLYLVLSTIVAIFILMVVTDSELNRGRDFISKSGLLLNKLISKNLIINKPISPDNNGIRREKTILYVLGGDQNTLMARFRIASSLYHKGIAGKIVILSRPGITEYSPDVGRNLTNDEWSIRELQKFEIKQNDIELVKARKGYFGTYNEAKEINKIILRNGIQRLILVTSLYHTRRAFLTFNKLISDNSVRINIYGSYEDLTLSDLIVEYAKLILYKNVLLQTEWRP